MRYFLVILLLLILTIPAAGYAGDAVDTWPCAFGTLNVTFDNIYTVFYDQGGAAWDARRLQDNQALQSQWTPQRNAIGWRGSGPAGVGGTWNVTYIRDATPNALVTRISPDDQWLDENGGWNDLAVNNDEDWTAVDVETRQNYIWGFVDFGGPWTIYLDLTAGVPAWTIPAPAVIDATTSNHFSVCLDTSLAGIVHIAYLDSDTGNVIYSSGFPPGVYGALRTIAAADYPQVVIDKDVTAWVFYTLNNILYAQCSARNFQLDDFAAESPDIYTATTLTDDYHTTWLATPDDTIHVVLVDFDALGINATDLQYLRRTPNGWTAPVTLLTVDSRPGGDGDSIEWPQITVDPFGNIFVYYILDTDWGDPAVGGDLQGFYLDASDYSDPVVGNWTQHTNIDGSADNILWCVAPDSIPVSGEM